MGSVKKTAKYPQKDICYVKQSYIKIKCD